MNFVCFLNNFEIIKNEVKNIWKYKDDFETNVKGLGPDMQFNNFKFLQKF